jgi:hypothetical protein
MEISHEKTTSIGFGFSTLADAFQAGREAAQMAKSQTPDMAIDLALAVGPADIHFKDFVEGVRLMTGENALVGLPAPWVFATDAPNSRTRAVLLLRSEGQRLTIVSSPEESNPLVTVTSLLTDLRSERGNAQLDFDLHGLIAIDNHTGPSRPLMTRHLAADAGLESWLVSVSLWPSDTAPMICGPQIISRGITALECLSNGSWGTGWVETSSFPGETDVLREAARASMREAIAQLQSRKPSSGLLLVASQGEPFPEAEAHELFRAAGGVAPHLPLIGFPVRSPFLRTAGRTIEGQEGVVSLLVPQ